MSDQVVKMINCENCGRKLGAFEGYRHPTLGKKHLLCSPCFEQTSENVKKWGEFVLSNSFVVESSNNGLKLDWKKIAATFNQIQKNISLYFNYN